MKLPASARELNFTNTVSGGKKFNAHEGSAQHGSSAAAGHKARYLKGKPLALPPHEIYATAPLSAETAG
jgi:hypothetical protein